MKKTTTLWISLGIGGALVIGGIGTIAGTYNQYSNYQLLSNYYNNSNDEVLKTLSLDEFVTKQSNYVLSNKQIYEGILKSFKTAYPTFSSFKNLASDQLNYQLVVTLFYIPIYGNTPTTDFPQSESQWLATYSSITAYDYNVAADRNGFIVGITLLSIGFVTCITSLIVYVVKVKHTKQENN